MKEENLQFRMMYLIGIIFVVASHCGGGGVFNLGSGYFPITSFFMELFFFCSGYFYKKEYCLSRGFIIKFKRLVIPCFIYNIVYGCIVSVLHALGYTIGGRLSVYNVLVTPFTYGSVFQFNCPDWFVGQLFVVEIVYMVIRKIVKDKERKIDVIILAALIIVSCFNVKVSIEYEISSNVLLIFRAIYCLAWYEIGHFYRKWLQKIEDIKNVTYFLGIFFVQLILIIVNQGNLGGSVVRFKFSETYAICVFLDALTGIALWLRVCKILAPVCMKSKVLLYISRHTFTILQNHITCFFVVNIFLSFVGALCGDVLLFETTRFKTDYLYRVQLVSGDLRINIIYLFAGIALPLVILAGFDKIKKFRTEN